MIVGLLGLSISVALGIEICNISSDQLKICKPAVTKPNPEKPTTACCKLLGAANITCFCEYGKDYPYVLTLAGIDPDLAKALPQKCDLSLPAACKS